jgi:hypothetical protein
MRRRLIGFLMMAGSLIGLVYTIKNGPVAHVPHEIMPATDADWRPMALLVVMGLIGFEMFIYTGKGKG